MKTRHQTTETDQAKPPGRTALMADAFTPASSAERPRHPVPPLEWQALLLRYLPPPVNANHSVKRFAAR